MFTFLRQLFCIHDYEYDYDDDMFISIECRKCDKKKPA